jgi:hypothetical protein
MSETQSISSSKTEHFLQEHYGSGIADVKQAGEGGWSLAFAFVLDWGSSFYGDSFAYNAFKKIGSMYRKQPVTL